MTLGDINFQDTKNMVQFNDAIEFEISKTIFSYYFDDCLGDSSETYFKVKDIYIGGLWLYDSSQTLFVLIFKHPLDDLINSKVLFYDNLLKEFIGGPMDFNLHALYDFHSGKIKPSYLRRIFKITSPEIRLINNDKDGQRSVKFTRLYHNGSANAIETTILRVNENKMDTIDFKQDWLGLELRN